MKKITFVFIAFAMGVFQFLNAQTWDAPSYSSDMPTAGNSYYVYNVGAKGFLVRGGYWGTHCAVASYPSANATSGAVKWRVAELSTGVFSLEYVLNDTPSNTYIFHDGDWDAWGDGAATRNDRGFLFVETDTENHIVSIQNDVFVGIDKYFGWSGYSETTNKGTSDAVFTDKASGGDNVRWKFISQANYDLYQAKVTLDKYLTYAKAKGGIDLASYIATYNANVTNDITTASANLLAALAPEDVTSLITNPSFESGLTGWTNSGFQTQTNTAPFTKDGTTYVEKYVGGPSNLPAATITQTLAVPNGVYQLQMTGHAFQQAGSNPLHTFAFATCGSKSVEISAPGTYRIDNVEVTNGTLTIGYKLEGAIACNWTGFDNFKLFSYNTFSTPALGASTASIVMDDIIPSASFTVNSANLSAPINITAPTGVTVSPTQLPANSSNAPVTVTYDGASTVNGDITLTSGNSIATIHIKASSNATCFTPLYTSGNLIADPTFTNSISDFASGGYKGWGPKAIDSKNPYCGAASAYILGSCWPNGGSLDRDLTTANGNALKPNTTYRLRAMINSQATEGTAFQFQIEGYDGTTSKYFFIEKTTGWTQFDETFTTGATTTEKGIYFNSCSSTSPAVTDTCFIDNYELYEVVTGTGLTQLNKNNLVISTQDNNIFCTFESSSQTPINVTVLNLQGKVLIHSEGTALAGKNEKVITHNFPAGVYFIKFNSDALTQTKKLIIR